MTTPASAPGVAARVVLGPVRAYRRWVSPLLPARCRFVPSCSAYAEEAVHTHGAARGSWLAARRVSRCHPFHDGGLDPVPVALTRPARPTPRRTGAHGARTQ